MVKTQRFTPKEIRDLSDADFEALQRAVWEEHWRRLQPTFDRMRREMEGAFLDDAKGK